MSYADRIRRAQYQKLYNGHRHIPGTFVAEIYIRDGKQYNEVHPIYRWIAHENQNQDQKAISEEVAFIIDSMVMRGNVAWWNKNGGGK